MKKRFREAFELKLSDSQDGKLEIAENQKDRIVVWIEAIHAMTTGNYTTYTARELRGDKDKKTGQYSWTYPYEKPVLKFHKSRDGEPIGRVLAAKFSNTSQAGLPVIRLKVEITDKDAIEKVKDGRYKTVSIGGTAEHAYCSICGQDWLTEGMCEHWPGREYGDDHTVCTMILGDLDFKEVSFVNVPADQYAMVISIVDEFEESLNNSAGSYTEKQKDNIAFENTQGGKSMEKLQDKVVSLEEKLNIKEEKIAVYEQKISNLEGQVNTLREQNETLTEQKEILEGKIENLNSEVERLLNENADLKKKQHENLAEQVVDLKIKLGRVKEEDKEAKVEEHIKRTSESLHDTLKDLQEELAMLEEKEESYEEGEKVENPGLNSSNEEQVVQEDTVEEDDKEVDSKLTDIVYR